MTPHDKSLGEVLTNKWNANVLSDFISTKVVGLIICQYSVYFCLLVVSHMASSAHTMCSIFHTHRMSNTNAVDCPHVDGLVQEKCNFSAWAMELRLSCTNPSNCVDGSLSKKHQDKTGRLQFRLQSRRVKYLEGWIKSSVIVSGDTHRIVCHESIVQLIKIQFQGINPWGRVNC